MENQEDETIAIIALLYIKSDTLHFFRATDGCLLKQNMYDPLG